MGTALAEAIDRLHVVFGGVPRPSAIDSCPCCFTPDDERKLLAPVPLAELTADDLGDYAAVVLFTVGGVADYRYFLPRMLEIGCTEGFLWPDLEPLLGRLRHAGWRSWPAGERHAVRELLAALWAEVLADDPAAVHDVDTVLCAVGNVEDDLTPYLAEWARQLARPTAAAALFDLLAHHCRPAGTTWRLGNAFWAERGSQAAQVSAWLAGADLRRAVTAALGAVLETAETDGHAESTWRILTELDDLLGRVVAARP
ncbi:hypothetical protein C6361_22360 [Plantactinospora sp. BC1]|uniref:hypothetical protein n=1 Tax=Plantactinospora sp. BC1 TaxID=2108470 RepID=UPI000D167565|nr:hypothetical protein [Plantactinospora sp. BC1]AVT31758.1 hypothetical protein C6361_22360 [Plantactinospora sp. BC1]